MYSWRVADTDKHTRPRHDTVVPNPEAPQVTANPYPTTLSPPTSPCRPPNQFDWYLYIHTSDDKTSCLHQLPVPSHWCSRWELALKLLIYSVKMQCIDCPKCSWILGVPQGPPDIMISPTKSTSNRQEDIAVKADTGYRLSYRGYSRRLLVFLHQAFDASPGQELVSSPKTPITRTRIGKGISDYHRRNNISYIPWCM